VAAAHRPARQPDDEAPDRDRPVLLGAPPTYFFPDESLAENAVPADLAAALGDAQIREMALRAVGLSDRSLKAITDMINNARTVEGLPDAGSSGDNGNRIEPPQ